MDVGAASIVEKLCSIFGGDQAGAMKELSFPLEFVLLAHH
jgi:hypothetical protein